MELGKLELILTFRLDLKKKGKRKEKPSLLTVDKEIYKKFPL